MKVGVLCEFSGVVRDAFIRHGHNAVSCDLLPSEAPGPHIQGDCLAQDWSWADVLIFHAPCTYLCNSGVRWLWNENGGHNFQRWEAMKDAANFFIRCAGLGRCTAGENPIMHRYARRRIGSPAQIIQPWM